jgi:hypothetical protein
MAENNDGGPVPEFNKAAAGIAPKDPQGPTEKSPYEKRLFGPPKLTPALVPKGPMAAGRTHVDRAIREDAMLEHSRQVEKQRAKERENNVQSKDVRSQFNNRAR